MKKKITLGVLLTVFAFSSKAQCPANDNTAMGDKTSNDVYYNFVNKTVATVSNTNWHMAFSVQSPKSQMSPANSVAIKVNSGGNGTLLKKLTGADASQWRTIDTAGFYAAADLYDSDSTWDLSAFTKGYPVGGNPFNFGWGSYNLVTHNVDGTNVFVIYNQAAGWYKKVFINKCAGDSVWNFVISNLNNTDSTNITFNKHNYPNKLFVYYNATTHQLIDREPAKSTWDLLWTKYVTYVSSSMGSALYQVAGVFSNPAVTVEQNNGLKCNEVWLSNKTSVPDPRISVIGYDWKTFNGATYDITDTFVYFVKSQNGNTNKLSFNTYVGGTQGISSFHVEGSSAVKSIKTLNAISVYPNPGHGVVSVTSPETIRSIAVLDVQGKIVTTQNGVNQIDISKLPAGVYIISVTTAAGIYHEQLIKE